MTNASETVITVVIIATLWVTFWLGKQYGKYEYVTNTNALAEIVRLQRKIDAMESAVRLLRKIDRKQRESEYNESMKEKDDE